MSKQVLVIWWSQSGQLERVADAFTAPFEQAGHRVVRVRVRPRVAYPFPWGVTRFFGLFPETVLERPVELEAIEIPEGDWDLVVFATTIWFLSPNQPMAAFLQSPHRDVLAGKRVLTLVGCRNMWISGWRRTVARIQAAGGEVGDRVIAIHGGPVFASYFSTLFWMLTGKRDAIKALPAAAIPEATFAWLTELGGLAAERLDRALPGPLLADRDTASISHTHALGEQLMARVFAVLARIIAALSRPGTALRSFFAVGMLGVILSAVLTLVVPCALFRLVFGRFVDPWLESLASLPLRPSLPAEVPQPDADAAL